MIGATIVKDVWLLLRDRGRLISLFALPVAFIVVFGSMFKFGSDRGKPQPIAIWYVSGDVRGDKIRHALDETPGFAADPRGSAEAVRAAVAHEEVSAGLIVPDAGPVELSIDLAAPIQVRAGTQGALTGVVMRAISPMTGPPPIEPKSPPGIAKPIDQITGFQVTVPGNAVLFGFFIVMTVAITFASERHTGTWKRMLAAPIPRWKALVGKLVPYFLIGLFQLAFLFGLGAIGFGMKVAGSISALIALTVALELCAMGMGLLVASFGGTEKQIGSIVPVVILVMGLLGGCMFPRLLMPPFMKQLGHIVPQSWALDGYYDVLVRQGTSIADIAPSIGALCGFAALFIGFGLWRFRFER